MTGIGQGCDPSRSNQDESQKSCLNVLQMYPLLLAEQEHRNTQTQELLSIILGNQFRMKLTAKESRPEKRSTEYIWYVFNHFIEPHLKEACFGIFQSHELRPICMPLHTLEQPFWLDTAGLSSWSGILYNWPISMLHWLLNIFNIIPTCANNCPSLLNWFEYDLIFV